MKRTFLTWIALTGLASAAYAADTSRPSEDSIFGESAPNPTPSAVPAEAPGSPQSKDASELGAPHPERDAFASGEVTENPLQIGGTFYQRGTFSAQQGNSLGNESISLPLQVDGFFDARPNDRIRAFVDGRLLYDASRDQYSNVTSGSNAGSLQFSSTSSGPSGLSTTTLIPNNPTVALDQAWLKFDVARTVFVTAGKQHVKWGTSRYWNPTDFLNTQKRDPLLPYDLRLGTTEVKFEIPWESKKTNFYAIALFNNPVPASTFGQIGSALRAETVIGSTELGLDFIARNGVAPAYGADVSAPLGPFDIYGEVAFLTAAPSPSDQLLAAPAAGVDLSTLFSATAQAGPVVQVSGGANYSFAWEDNRQATLGFEAFYNQAGYANSNIYPILVYTGQFQPFYTGRAYAALYLTAEGPDAEKHTSYTFSTLGNLSDSSFISRIDFSWRALTYLTFEAYVDAHYGTAGGEFNFSLSMPSITSQGATLPPVVIAQTFADIGLGLRVSF